MKRFLRVLTAILLLPAVIFLPGPLITKLRKDGVSDEMYRRRESYYYGVINLWQVDSFEGGTGSRTNWLRSVCGGFERKHTGVYVNVESVSPAMAEKLIAEGKVPDMLSFSGGVEVPSDVLRDVVSPVSLLRPDLATALTDKAVPWCMGVYLMIGQAPEQWGKDGRTVKTKKSTKTVYSVGVAEKPGFAPLKALDTAMDFSDPLAWCFGSAPAVFEAYNYAGKVNSMLGTQRDLYRMKAAESREKLRDGTVTLLPYSDLIQYLSALKTGNEKKARMEEALITYLLSADVQSRLGSVGLLPVNPEAAPVYENARMQSLAEKAAGTVLFCACPLFPEEKTAAEQERIRKILQKDDGREKKIIE